MRLHRMGEEVHKGPSIKYVTLFLANFDPLPLSHFVTHPGTPRKYVIHLGPPDFLVGLVQLTRTKALCTKFSLNCSRDFLSGGFCQGVFCLEGFVQGGFCPFPLLSEYICYNKKLNINLNFMFHVYDKKIISYVTSHALDSPSPVTNCHIFSDPLERDVLYGRPL